MNPWNNRILQCRQVRPKNAAVNEDGGKLDRITSVQSSSSMRGKASVGANVPEAFTKVRVAFDLTRDRTKSKRVEIHCRMQNKYYFIGDKCMPGEKSAFEGLLQEYKEENESTFGDHWCEEFLKNHNNITHYVSSITLGAMTYTVLETSTKKDGFGVTTEVEVPHGGEAGGEFGYQKQKAALHLKHDAVGSLKDGEIKTLGVVHYECKPLTNLVSDPTLQKALKTAILQYEERKGNGTKAGYVYLLVRPIAMYMYIMRFYFAGAKTVYSSSSHHGRSSVSSKSLYICSGNMQNHMLDRQHSYRDRHSSTPFASIGLTPTSRS